MKEQPDSELYAELAALRQRLSSLEAEREAVRCQARHAKRPTFLRTVLLGPLPVALLVLGGGLLYAAGDALFIDSKGNVGIGSLEPQGFQVVLPEKDKPVNPKAGITLAGGLDGNASIEVRNNGTGTPYIDFAQNTGSDFDARLRLTEPGKLAIEGADLVTTRKVGIGTDPKVQLHVVGDAIITRNFDVGQITASKLSTGTFAADQPGIFSAGLSIYARGSAEALQVTGNARIDGGLTSKSRYQRNDEGETTYEISPRYHLSLSADQYDGATKLIPKQTLIDLCGDADGCDVRLGMTRWGLDSQTETASRSFIFYYSSKDGHWRSSSDAAGVVGNGKTEHAGNAWNTCFFTDGTYSKRSDQSDKGAGMALLVWHGTDKEAYNYAKRTCELTLID